jgi:hypothetical protein
MGRFSEQRDGICKVPANGLDYREGPENEERNQKAPPAGIMPMLMSTVPVMMLMRRMYAVTCVLVIVVVLVRVRHGFGSPISGCILKTL